jgi:hypothetical protein
MTVKETLSSSAPSAGDAFDSSIWPATAKPVSKRDLVIGGVAMSTVARTHGTPVYVIDEMDMRQRCREYVDAFRHGGVAFTAKALLTRAIARWVAEERLGLYVSSVGELHVAQAVGFPANRIVFYGNAKTPQDLRGMAVGRERWTRVRRRLWQPPRRHGQQPLERTVSPVELFYDLVVVALVAEAAHHLAGQVTGRGLAEYAAVFALVWIAWLNGSLYHDLHGRDDVRGRTLLLVQILALVLLGACIPAAGGTRGRTFAAAAAPGAGRTCPCTVGPYGGEVSMRLNRPCNAAGISWTRWVASPRTTAARPVAP